MRLEVTAKMIGVSIAVLLTGLVASANIGHAVSFDVATLTFGEFDSLTFDNGLPSELTLTPKSLVSPTTDPLSNPTDSLDPTDPDNRGKLIVGDLGNLGSSGPTIGIGVKNFKNAKVGGSKGISGAKAHDDELVIFSFPNSSATANTIRVDLIGLNDLDCITCPNDSDDVISLQIEFSDNSTQVISRSVVADAITPTNGAGTLEFANLSGLNGTQIDNFALRVNLGHIGIAGISFTPTPVPEPGTLLLLVSGLLGLGFLRRKKQGLSNED